MSANHVAFKMLKMLRATYPNRWRAQSEREIVRVCAEAVPDGYAKIDGEWVRLYVHATDLDVGALYAKDQRRI